MVFLDISEYKQLVYLVAKVAKQSVNKADHHGEDMEIPLRQFFKDVGHLMDTLDDNGSTLDGN